MTATGARDAKPKRKRGQVYEDADYAYDEPQSEGVSVGGLFAAAIAACFNAVVGLLRWCWRTFMRSVGFVWRISSGVLMWMLRLSGRILVWAWHQSAWAIKLPFRFTMWTLRGLVRWYHGAPVDPDAPPLKQLHALVRRYYRRRTRFIAHSFGFTLVNGLLWLPWFVQSRQGYYFSPASDYLFFTGFWLFLLAFHFVRMKMGEGEDAALRAVIEQHGYTSGYEEVSYESSRYSRLATDEGDVDADETWEREQVQYEEKPKRR
jgi:hypothetical protein